MSEMEKETKIGRGKAKTPMKAAQDAQDRQPKDKCTFCICHEPDDGTPMVFVLSVMSGIIFVV
jgi:hypothetical protein